MTPLDQLLAVQELDTRLDQLAHRRAGLPERELVREAEAVLGTNRHQIAEQEEVVADLVRAQRRVEDHLASLEAKAVEIDRTLYGGTVSNARELQDLQAELDSVRRHISSVEDDAIAAMERLEPEQERLATLTEQRRAIEEHRARAEVQLTAAAAEIDAEAGELAAQRAAAVDGVPADLLDHYERLRASLGGVGVARLARNRCEGCHLTLSAVEVDRIRHLPPDELVHCEECGRLLVR